MGKSVLDNSFSHAGQLLGMVKQNTLILLQCWKHSKESESVDIACKISLSRRQRITKYEHVAGLFANSLVYSKIDHTANAKYKNINIKNGGSPNSWHMILLHIFADRCRGLCQGINIM